MSGVRVTMTMTLLAAALLGISGCGQDSGSGPGGSVTPSPSTSSPDGSTAAADLTIVVDDGAGKKTTWHLTCSPAGGDHPTPDKACTVLAEHGRTALSAVAPDRMCTEIFGGPQTAHIVGTWRGESVDTRLSRNNGCEIARWDALVGLLPAASA